MHKRDQPCDVYAYVGGTTIDENPAIQHIQEMCTRNIKLMKDDPTNIHTYVTKFKVHMENGLRIMKEQMVAELNQGTQTDQSCLVWGRRENTAYHEWYELQCTCTGNPTISIDNIYIKESNLEALSYYAIKAVDEDLNKYSDIIIDIVTGLYELLNLSTFRTRALYGGDMVFRCTLTKISKRKKFKDKENMEKWLRKQTEPALTFEIDDDDDDDDDDVQ